MNNKYLIKNAGQIYTVTGGALVAVQGSLSASLFQSDGFDDISNIGALLATLSAPTVFCWNADALVTISASLDGVPLPQTIETAAVNLVTSEIISVSEVSATYTGEPLCAISIDGGAYIMYNSNDDTWDTASAYGGMNIADMQSISEATWTTLISNATTFRLRIVLPTDADTVSAFTVSFLTN